MRGYELERAGWGIAPIHDHAWMARAPVIARAPWSTGPQRFAAEYRRLTGRRWVPPSEVPVAPTSGQPRAYTAVDNPGHAPDRVRYFEPARFLPDQTGVIGSRGYELVRVRVPAEHVGVLERLATFLRVQALDAQGAPVGAPFITNTLTDPTAVIAHPTPAEGVFAVTWRLSIAGASVDRSASLLTGAPLVELPGRELEGEIPYRWSDFRYSWGGRYSEAHRVTLGGAVTVTLCLEVTLTSAAWSWRAGGLLSGFYQLGGYGRAALASATSRD